MLEGQSLILNVGDVGDFDKIPNGFPTNCLKPEKNVSSGAGTLFARDVRFPVNIKCYCYGRILKISCQHCRIQDFLKGAPEFFGNFAEIEKRSGSPGSSSMYNYEYASWEHFYLELEFHKYNKY